MVRHRQSDLVLAVYRSEDSRRLHQLGGLLHGRGAGVHPQADRSRFREGSILCRDRGWQVGRIGPRRLRWNGHCPQRGSDPQARDLGRGCLWRGMAGRGRASGHRLAGRSGHRRCGRAGLRCLVGKRALQESDGRRQRMNDGGIRLTTLAHGGGCGCKLAPSVLQALLSGQAMGPFPRELLVGTETGDDAAVWQLDGDTCIIATTDFFMPMVDDPTDFGRIAACNAISDIYAMGGKPIMALAILGMPVDKIPSAAVRAILAGGATVCASVGIPVAGGHSIDCPEPVYGLAVIGTAWPGTLSRTSNAIPGCE